MAQQVHLNNAQALLTADLEGGSVTSWIALDHPERFGQVYPGRWVVLTLSDAAGASVEVVKVTALTENAAQVERAQEGTTARAWPAGTVVEARLTAGMLDRFVVNGNPSIWGLALGTTKENHSENSVVLGSYSEAPGPGGVAVGSSARARGFNSVALGSAVAYGASSVALGEGAAWRDSSLGNTCVPCVPRDDWWAGYGAQYNMGGDVVFASQYLDLGVPPVWTPDADYLDGAVVRPSVDAGLQFTLWADGFDVTVLNVRRSGAAEPEWPGAVGDSVQEGLGSWLAWSPLAGVTETFPPGMIFYPVEVGFICFNYGAVTADPVVSIGTADNPALLVDSQPLDAINGAQQRHAFAGLRHGVADIKYTLITPAAGGSFHGRFYAKGVFIQSQG